MCFNTIFRVDEYSKSLQLSSSLLSHKGTDQDNNRDQCENGWRAEDGSCSCNPCWSGQTCQDYGKLLPNSSNILCVHKLITNMSTVDV